MFAKSLLTRRRFEMSSFEKLTLHSLMIVVMMLYKCRSPTWYHLSRLGLMRAQCKDVLSEILPFFLVTINSGYSEPKFSWQAVSVRFFSRVPLMMMELLLDISRLAVTESLIWRRVTILKFMSDGSVGDGCWSSSAGLANVDESNAVDIFLEAVGRITKVLCSLLLRTCSKDIGAMQSGQTAFGGGLLARSVGIQSSKGFCDPMNLSCCKTGIRQVKPSYW